jgi:hypothetical protein
MDFSMLADRPDGLISQFGCSTPKILERVETDETNGYRHVHTSDEQTDGFG